MLVPLSHVAQSTAEFTQIDPSIVASALFVAMASGLAAIWRPRDWQRANPFRHRAPRRRLIGVAMAVLAFLAVLPSVVPVDHIVFTHSEDSAHDEVHAAHCHTSPGTCSDLPLQSGPGQFLLSDPLIVVPALIAVLIVVTWPLLVGFRLSPEVPPPRRALAFA